MIRQEFHVRNYWKVIVFYDIDYNFFDSVRRELLDIGAEETSIGQIKDIMETGEGKAFTYSSTDRHISVVVFNKHASKKDYLNSIVHEAEHIKQAILRSYNVKDTGEDAAYTIGYLIGRMYEVFNRLVCCNINT